jgi:DNA-3-methyladenine glycosylase
VSRDLDTLLAGPVVPAARSLLGRRLRSEVEGEVCEVVLTEVEAYDGANDPASHAYRGPTERTRSMFGPPRRLYVYRSYGVHWCMNVVTGPDGTGAAVLLRGGRPVAGRAVMERRRGRNDRLADGPGKLAQALGITGEHDGIDLAEGPLRLLDDEPVGGTVLAGPRVGISKAADRPWRFVLTEVI